MAMFTVLCLIITHCALYSEGFELISDAQSEAYVVGDSIIVYAPTVSTQSEEDARNGTLFAQLAANAKYSRKEDPLNWYKDYTNVLTDMGFITQSFSSFDIVGDNTFTIEQVVLDELKKVAGQGSIAKTAMDALGKLPANDKAVNLFVNRSTNSASVNGSCQVVVCDTSPTSGAMVLNMAVLYFKANKYNGRFLWSQWNKADIALRVATLSVLLNEDIYPRDTVASRVKEYVPSNVAEFNI